jgi:hypothetical protein
MQDPTAARLLDELHNLARDWPEPAHAPAENGAEKQEGGTLRLLTI